MDISSLMQMTWVFPVVGGVIALLVLWRVVGGLLKGQAQDRKLLQTGAKASAQVLTVQATGASVSYGGHRQPQVALRLQVQPENGQPFQAQVVSYVSELQIPQIGLVACCRFVTIPPTRPRWPLRPLAGPCPVLKCLPALFQCQ